MIDYKNLSYVDLVKILFQPECQEEIIAYTGDLPNIKRSTFLYTMLKNGDSKMCDMALKVVSNWPTHLLLWSDFDMVFTHMEANAIAFSEMTSHAQIKALDKLTEILKYLDTDGGSKTVLPSIMHDVLLERVISHLKLPDVIIRYVLREPLYSLPNTFSNNTKALFPIDDSILHCFNLAHGLSNPTTPEEEVWLSNFNMLGLTTLPGDNVDILYKDEIHISFE